MEQLFFSLEDLPTSRSQHPQSSLPPLHPSYLLRIYFSKMVKIICIPCREFVKTYRFVKGRVDKERPKYLPYTMSVANIKIFL